MPVVDMHIHAAAIIDDPAKPCRLSSQQLYNPVFFYLLARDHISLPDLLRDFNATIERAIVGRLQEASTIDYGVLLALDGVCPAYGMPVEPGLSHLLVSNRYVQELCGRFPHALFGASINPNRGEVDARDELEDVIEGGDGRAPASLMKILPNCQLIDLESDTHEWYWRTLEKASVPVLCHCGPEYAVHVTDEKNQLLGDPKKLERVLSRHPNLKVIVAHAATRYFATPVLSAFDPYDYLNDLGEMMTRHSNLYADISAMCNLFRGSTVYKVRDKLPAERLLLGSDYPVPVDAMPPSPSHGYRFDEYVKVAAINNPFDRNHQQLLAMGYHPSISTRFWDELMPKRAKDWRLTHR